MARPRRDISVGGHFILLNENGSIVTFAALTFFVMLCFVALAVDAGRIAGANTEKRGTAGKSALAALEQYFGHEVDPLLSDPQKHYDKFIEGKKRAETAASWNKITVRGEAQATSGELWAGPNQPGIKGRVQSGRWWFPSVVSPVCTSSSPPACPCSSTLPCYEPCDDVNGCAKISSSATEKIFANAMRVDLWTEKIAGGGVKSSFAQLLGIKEVEVSGSADSLGYSAIAAALSKATVLLVQVSRSTTHQGTTPLQSFAPWEQDNVANGGEIPREYAYLLKHKSCALAPVDKATWQIQGPEIIGPLDTPMDATPFLQQQWDNFSIAERGEYDCFDVVFGTASQAYAVNWHVDPQPLTDILDATYGYLTQVRTDSNEQDLISVAFFDQDANVSTRKYPFMSKLSGAFSNLMLLLTPGPDATVADRYLRMKRRIEAGLIPRTKKVGTKFVQAYADVPNAMADALTQIRNGSNLVMAENSVVLFTDGMTNCIMTGGSPPRNCVGYPITDSAEMKYAGTVPGLPPWTAPQRDAHIEKHYIYRKRSLDEAVWRNGTDLYRARVRMHVMMAGQDVRPHTILMKNPANSKCFSSKQMRVLNVVEAFNTPVALPDTITGPGVDVVVGDPFDQTNELALSTSGDSSTWKLGASFVPLGTQTFGPSPPPAYIPQPFLLPNYYFFELVRALRGDWVPLRPPCPLFGDAAWNGFGSTDEVCNAYTGSTIPGFLTDPYDSRLYNVDGDGSGGVTLDPRIIDSDGRFWCAPPTSTNSANTIEQQAKASAKVHYGMRPIVLVKPLS